MAGNGETTSDVRKRRAASPVPKEAAATAAVDKKAKGNDSIHPVFFVLKAGTVLNLFLLWKSFSSEAVVNVRLPAQIFFGVSAYRCMFPNRYSNSAVLHDTIFSSSLITRILATFTEISWIYQLSYIAQTIEVPADSAAVADLLAQLMLVQCAISQLYVWVTVISGVGHWMFWEELGWAVIFILNTTINWWGRADPHYQGHARISIVYACLFLPYHLGLHLPSLYKSRAKELATGVTTTLSWEGIRRAATVRKPTRNLEDFGGFVGAIWMVGYWAVLPLWHAYIIS